MHNVSLASTVKSLFMRCKRQSTTKKPFPERCDDRFFTCRQHTLHYAVLQCYSHVSNSTHTHACTHTHTRTHARTHARMHARTHARTYIRTQNTYTHPHKSHLLKKTYEKNGWTKKTDTSIPEASMNISPAAKCTGVAPSSVFASMICSPSLATMNWGQTKWERRQRLIMGVNLRIVHIKHKKFRECQKRAN